MVEGEAAAEVMNELEALSSPVRSRNALFSHRDTTH